MFASISAFCQFNGVVAEQVLINHVLFHFHLLHLHLVSGFFLDLIIFNLVCDLDFYSLILLPGDPLLLGFLLDCLSITFSANPDIDLGELLLEQLLFLGVEDLLGHSDLLLLLNHVRLLEQELLPGFFLLIFYLIDVFAFFLINLSLFLLNLESYLVPLLINILFNFHSKESCFLMDFLAVVCLQVFEK